MADKADKADKDDRRLENPNDPNSPAASTAAYEEWRRNREETAQPDTVPEDVRAHPAITAVWETIDGNSDDNPVRTGWNGTQVTVDNRD